MKKVSLNELMGSSAQQGNKKMSLNDIKDLLGDRAPKLEFSPVGRLRLTTALRNRFGDGFRNLPGIDDILKEFDTEAKFHVKLNEIKLLKSKGK